MVRNRSNIDVLYEGDSEGKTPRVQGKWVQAALSNVVLKLLLSNLRPPASCMDAGRIRMIACDYERSVELYNVAIAEVGEVELDWWW